MGGSRAQGNGRKQEEVEQTAAEKEGLDKGKAAKSRAPKAPSAGTASSTSATAKAAAAKPVAPQAAAGKSSAERGPAEKGPAEKGPAEKGPAGKRTSEKRVVYDADHAVLGRAATRIAKQLLSDPEVEVIVVNAEKAVITGSRVFILNRYKERRSRGSERKGPYYPRRADRIFKRTVRGMLPYQLERGRTAFKRLKCYHGVPKQFAGKAAKIEGATQLRTAKFLTLEQISKSIGG